jgi:hypothetical protein
VASELGLEAAIIESDSKSCMDAINGKLLEIPWRLNGFLDYISPFKSANPNWVFNWVFRDANEAPHCLAKWSLMNFLWGVYDFCNGPPSFVMHASRTVAGPSFVGCVVPFTFWLLFQMHIFSIKKKKS